jgi:hypothetical protein
VPTTDEQIVHATDNPHDSVRDALGGQSSDIRRLYRIHAYQTSCIHATSISHRFRGGSSTVDLQEYVLYDREYRPLRWA